MLKGRRLVPSRHRMRMMDYSGRWVWVLVTPVVIMAPDVGGPIVLYLLSDGGDEVWVAGPGELVGMFGVEADGSDSV